MSLPPSGMASRALSARLRIAVASWLGSTVARQVSSSNTDSISICSPSVGRSSFAVSMISVLTSVSCGCSGCLRAKASRCWVRSAPRDAASSIILVMAASCGSSSTASARISIVPVITVRILLKSCAMPPVSWPTASIFSACRIRSSAAILSVRSRMKPLNTKPSRRLQRGDAQLDLELLAVAPPAPRFRGGGRRIDLVAGEQEALPGPS